MFEKTHGRDYVHLYKNEQEGLYSCCKKNHMDGIMSTYTEMSEEEFCLGGITVPIPKNIS